jgi:hypothetical protein
MNARRSGRRLWHATDYGGLSIPYASGEAIVVDPAVCFLPGGRRTSDSHLVVTPSLHVQLTCRFQP